MELLLPAEAEHGHGPSGEDKRKLEQPVAQRRCRREVAPRLDGDVDSDHVCSPGRPRLMPLPGGAADKFGNRYEREWTVHAITRLLERDEGTIRIEVPGADGDGFEFRFQNSSGIEWHQAKRQRAAGHWSIRELDKVLRPWWLKLNSGEMCCFVSGEAAPELRELADRARSAADWSEFAGAFLDAKSQRKNFEDLRALWPEATEESTFESLKLVRVRTMDHVTLTDLLLHRIRAYTGGNPEVVAALLLDYVDQATHVEFSASDVREYLADHGIARRFDSTVVSALKMLATKFLGSRSALRIGGSLIQTYAMAEAIEACRRSPVTVLLSPAGGGKSAVVTAVMENADTEGWPVLPISADRLPDVQTATQLGEDVGLGGSCVAALAAAAKGGDALLVIDQLDAVGTVSGRHPERLAVIEDVLAEAAAHPNIRVLLACREFDLTNDRVLRSIITEAAVTIRVGPLSSEDVRAALARAGLTTTSASEVEFLSSPLNLALLLEVSRGETPLPRSRTSLYDRYWDEKQRACRQRRNGVDEWVPAIDLLVDVMSDRQELAVPQASIDTLRAQADAMTSEAVLTTTLHRIGFVHETLFDYCWSRRFLGRGGDLAVHLLNGEQDLFRRSQVRQLLDYERATDPVRFRADAVTLLTNGHIRRHIKVLVAALLGALEDPTPDDWQVLRDCLSLASHEVFNAFWVGVRANPRWFEALDEAGEWESWLSSSEEPVRGRALWTLSGINGASTERVSDLVLHGLSTRTGLDEIVGFLYMSRVDCSPAMAERIAAGVTGGELDGSLDRLWSAVVKSDTTWPAPALNVAAAIVRRALTIGGREQVERGVARHHQSDLVDLARAAPAPYITHVLPIVLEMATAAAQPTWRSDELLTDEIWHFRYHDTAHDLGDYLLLGAEAAMSSLAQTDPDSARNVIAALDEVALEVAAVVSGSAFIGNPRGLAADAVSWLSASPARLSLGYADRHEWISRQIVTSVVNFLDEQQRQELQRTIVGYTTPWERTFQGLRARGLTELALLNGFGEAHLTAGGVGRLHELRRKFRIDDVAPPSGIEAGVVPPAIPVERARHMTDRQWLRAMRRHDSPDSQFTNGRFHGGAFTQSQVLEALTSEQPERFGQLYLQLDRSIASEYRNAILQGLKNSEISMETLGRIFEHTLALADPEVDRCAAWFIEAKADRELPAAAYELLEWIATTDPDPVRDAWSGNEEGTGTSGGNTIEFDGINSNRGAAAQAIGQLVNCQPDRLPLLAQTIDRLAADPTEQVRAVLARSLAAVVYVDPSAALEWFGKLVEHSSAGLLGSHYVEHFVHHAVRSGRTAELTGFFKLQDETDDSSARAVRARQLTVASIADPAFDDFVDRCMQATPSERRAVLQVAAENVGGTLRRERLLGLLLRGLVDEDDNARAEASRVFYRIDRLHPTEVAQLVDTIAFAPDHTVAEGAFHALESYRHPLPNSTLDLCERFIDRHRTDIGNIATGAAASATDVVTLAIRLHAQSSEPETRSRCLDIIDALVAQRVHGIDAALAAIER